VCSTEFPRFEGRLRKVSLWVNPEPPGPQAGDAEGLTYLYQKFIFIAIFKWFQLRDPDIRPYLPTAGRDFRPQTKRGNFQRLQKDNQEMGRWGDREAIQTPDFRPQPF